MMALIHLYFLIELWHNLSFPQEQSWKNREIVLSTKLFKKGLDKV